MDGSFSRVPAWVLVPVALVGFGLGILLQPRDDFREVRNVPLKLGMRPAQFEVLLGDPHGYTHNSYQDQVTEKWQYGPYNSSKSGTTKYQLSLTFADGRLVEWFRSIPD